jgi:ATP-dependent 26S proteasome regulatory subunit
MDSDRWNLNKAWSLRSKPSREEQEEATTSAAATSSRNRYQHDMEQAKAMRKSMAGASLTSSSNINSSSSSREDDVRLGFVGLEQAEEQAQKGNLSEALRLYELSIELLIHFLRDTKSPSSSPAAAGTTTAAGQDSHIDRTTVEARIQAALCEAEAIKPLLSAQKRHSGSSSQQQQAAQSTKESPRSPATRGSSSSPPSSLATALQSALRRGTAMVQGQQRPTNNVRLSTKLPSHTRSNTVRGTTSTPTTRRATAQYAGQLSAARPLTTIKKTAPTPISPASPPPIAQSDALTQIVESDLMVDPASLSPVSWDDIAGLAAVKMSLQESAVLPMQRPDLFTGLRRPQNVLLWGPPGTGKTMLVRAVARESGSTLFCCSAATLTSKWMGEAEKLVRCLFRVARDRAPSIVFLDEVDALLSGRKSEEHEASRRLKTEFMVQMDGIHTHDSTGSSNTGSDAHASAIRHVLVLACTNCPWDIDSAVLRRFPRRILVPLPDEAARRGLLQHLLQKAGKHSLKNRDISKLVDRTQGFSCSDISAIAVQASFGPLRALGGMQAVRKVRAQDVRPITLEDFASVIDETTKSVSREQLRRYDDWQRQQAAS